MAFGIKVVVGKTSFVVYFDLWYFREMETKLKFTLNLLYLPKFSKYSKTTGGITNRHGMNLLS